jgi:pSer/pThr/pTyr-binding forkhead associated (FHA) protein
VSQKDEIVHICPVCGHENVRETLLCTQCLAVLGTKNLQSSTVDLTNLSEEDSYSTQRQDKHIGLLDVNSVALYIGDNPEPMIIDATNVATLGRTSPNSVYQPMVDLTRYGAFERGMSRLHAAIQRVGDQFMVTDLKSSNGTWLNGKRLEPDVPMVLRSGDRLKLSLMRIDVYFEEN